MNFKIVKKKKYGFIHSSSYMEMENLIIIISMGWFSVFTCIFPMCVIIFVRYMIFPLNNFNNTLFSFSNIYFKLFSFSPWIPDQTLCIYVILYSCFFLCKFKKKLLVLRYMLFFQWFCIHSFERWKQKEKFFFKSQQVRLSSTFTLN